MFQQGIEPVKVARCLRVSASRRTSGVGDGGGGEAALASRGPGGAACRLSERQLARLRAALDLGPAAYGWRQDQRWTLARVPR